MDALVKLKKIQDENSSMLCVGLDTEISRLPEGVSRDCKGIFDFNRAIIESTKDLVCAYKINFAFYEQYGAEGYSILKQTLDFIPGNIFKIADVKRSDIANTSAAYARACYEHFGSDAATLNPYMGKDSIEPYLAYKDRLAFLLTITSNPGASTFQKYESGGVPLYRYIVETGMHWGKPSRLGFIVGATNPDELDELRNLAPDYVFLIPGIGAQGGSMAAMLKANAHGPAIINASRSVIYASKEKDFAEKAREKAYKYKLSFL